MMNHPTFVKFINDLKSGLLTKVTVLTGAGISVASGIPDFRSPGGMFNTLKPHLLTATTTQKNRLISEPTLVVDIELFKVNQFPYLEVRRPFILGTAQKFWKPTLAHYFLQILAEKNVLQRIYTQNIDGLDFHLTNIPSEKVIAVHGSIGKIECEFCRTPMDSSIFCEEVKTKIKNIYDESDDTAPKESLNILCSKCKRPGMKPATVLFGTSLPKVVWQATDIDFPNETDALLVIGTSLAVSPINYFVTKVRPDVPRVVINLQPVGEEIGLDYSSEESRDVMLTGSCDDVCLKLIIALGWLDDIKRYKDCMCQNSARLLQSVDEVK